MSRKKRIAVDCRMVEHSGIGRYIQMIMPFLAENFKVTTMGCAELLSGYDWFDKDRHIELKSNIYNPLEQIELSFKIPATDLFWSPHFTVPVFSIRARKRVVTVHDMFHLRYIEDFGAAATWYLKLLFSKVSKSDRVITVSEFSKREIDALTDTPPDKIEVIHNGVDTEKFGNSTVEPEIQGQQMPEQYLLYVGNVKPHKNLKRLVKAFSDISDEFPDMKLVIAGKMDGFINGDPELRNIIEENSSLKSRVIFTGYVKEEMLPALYRKSSALVFPSIYEGFGLPPLEAMAAEVPVIAADSASIPEVCGEGALYFDPESEGDIAEKISKLLKDKNLASELVKTGRLVVNGFRWSASASKHVELFKELLKES